MGRITKNPDVRKSELLDAAELLFLEKGYVHTTVSEIVKHIGVAQGTFYYYFKSKEDIVEAIAERLLDVYEQELIKISGNTNGDIISILQNFINTMVAHGREQHTLISFIYSEQNALIYFKHTIKFKIRFMPPLMGLIDSGISQGLFKIKYPDDTAEAVLIIFQNLYRSIASLSTEETEKKVRANLDILERLLGIDSGSLNFSAE